MRYLLLIILLLTSMPVWSGVSVKPQHGMTVRLTVVNLQANLYCAYVHSQPLGDISQYQTRFILPDGAELLESNGSCDTPATTEPWFLVVSRLIQTPVPLSQLQVILSLTIDNETFRTVASWPAAPTLFLREMKFKNLETDGTGVHIIRIGETP